jgi:cardiolipin synthase A/B
MGVMSLLLCRGAMMSALAAVVAAGCAHVSAPAPRLNGTPGIASADAPLAPGDVPLAEAAYVSGQEVFVRYRVGEKLAYAKSTRMTSNASVTFAARLPIADLVHVDEVPWAREAAGTTRVPVYGPAAWQQFLKRMRAAITPAEPGQGAVVDVLRERDLFYYQDEYGNLRTVPFEYKPPDVRVSAIYQLARLVRQAPAAILDPAGSALNTGIGVVSTGDSSEGGYPFVLLDAGRSEALFLRNVARPPSADPIVGTASLAATHVTASHLRSVLEQPVSSLTRLFTLVSSTTLDLVDPRQYFPFGAGPVPPLAVRPDMDTMAWERELDRLTGEKQTAGKIRYLVDGEAFFPRFVDAVASARTSVHIRLYIFDNDDVALRIADLLRRRSQEIDVKVLLDGLGTYGAAAASPDYSPHAQERDRSIDAYLTRDSQVHVRILANPWLTGDHTKSIVVDDRFAFIGGMNIGREYRYEWHDLMVELTGPVVDTLRTDFHKTWTQQTFLGDLRRWMARVQPVNAAAPDDYPIRVLVTAPQKQQILQTQLAAIRRAQRRIYIQNAYFTSDPILYELAAARRRGVDVRVIIPYHNDSGVINRSNAIAANAMLANGIRVYIYPGMSHLKGAVYDGWACLGSANFDSLSFAVNKELNIATSHGPAVEEFMERVFAPDFAKSVELTQPFPSQWRDFLSELLADRL